MKALVQQFIKEGFTLKVVNGKLHVSPAGRLNDGHRYVLNSNKKEIIAELSSVATNTRDVPLLAKKLLRTITAKELEELEDEQQALIESQRIDRECERIKNEKQTRQIGSGREILSRRFARD